MDKQLIAITGPTCGGKTTLKNVLLSLYAGQIEEIVTTTTRTPRPGELESGAYDFVSTMLFEQLAANQMLLEWVRYDGHFYGLQLDHLRQFAESAKSGVVVATESGLTALQKWCDSNDIAILRVLATAPVDELARRLEQRPDADRSIVERRRQRLLDEQAKLVDFSDYDVVVDHLMSNELCQMADERSRTNL